MAAMRLVINGEDRDLDVPVPTLAALLEYLGMKTDRVAVELNCNIVARDRWSDTRLGEGDRLEIVHFVGGGCGAHRRFPSSRTPHSRPS
jgi:thiamine biosynthesis protein ThiS